MSKKASALPEVIMPNQVWDADPARWLLVLEGLSWYIPSKQVSNPSPCWRCSPLPFHHGMGAAPAGESTAQNLWSRDRKCDYLLAMQSCLCAASPSTELCLFLHSPTRRGGASKPPPTPSPFFTSLREGHRDFPGESGSSIWTLSSLSLELCVPVTGADLSHVLPLFVFLYGISAHGRGGFMFRVRAAPGQLLKCRWGPLPLMGL